MESFHWDTYFETGLEDVDKQHFKLVELINQFGDLLAVNDLEAGPIEAIFEDLKDYAVFHFDEEEKMMEEAGISAKFLEVHKKVHDEFLKKVISMHRDISFDDVDSARPLLRYLMHWLVYHILGMDQNMARQIKAIETGVCPDKAYFKEKNEENNATEALLNALGSMFQQVSQRNKELEELNKTLEEKVAERTSALQKANENLKVISMTDVLTGLPNRRFAMEHLHKIWDKSMNQPISCMMIDADHFKEVNDTFGHDAGDLVLTTLGHTIQRSLRNDDIVCRLGGDEFLVICTRTNGTGALQVAEHVLQEVRKLKVITGDGYWQGSISLGVATQSIDFNQVDALIKAADQGVYLAKQAGKNCLKQP